MPSISPLWLLLLDDPDSSGVPDRGDGFKPALYAYLAEGLGAAVARVSPLRASRADANPALICRVSSRDRESLLAGPSAVRSATLEVRALSRSHGTTDRIIERVAGLFHARTHYAMGALAVIDSFADPDGDEFDRADDGSDDGTYEDAITIRFSYRVP